MPEIGDLFIDIGAADRKEAERLVRVGDPVTLSDEFELLRDDLAVARAFDNRIGTFAVAEALRLLGANRRKLKAEVCAVSNIAGEKWVSSMMFDTAHTSACGDSRPVVNAVI